VKVLFYNHTGQVSGAERVLQMILKGLGRDRYECVVACPENSQMSELLDAEGVRRRAVLGLEARFTWRPDHLLRYLSSFARVIRHARAVVSEESPDVIHANSIRAGIVMTAATMGLGIPVIWHAHDILPRHPLSVFIRLFAATSRHVSILAVSEAVARRFRGVIVGRRLPITTVHNSVDTERFRPNVESRSATRRRLGISETQRVIGIVGHLSASKGQFELVEAFAAISQQLTDAVLVIVGASLFNRERHYEESLTHLARSLGSADRVHFLGSRGDVPDLMRSFDLLVSNSRIEAFPLTVLEGMASGIPVLATAIGGTPEMITNNENGWLVPPGDKATLARSLTTLLNDGELRGRLGRNARQAAVARFSTDRFNREIDELYSRLSPRITHKIIPQLFDEKLAID
jgi:glycosyltransferase involved in cell wall biosynthesis